MPKSPVAPKPISILKSVLTLLTRYPIIFYPLVISIFLQLLVLEILFFAPRPPLSVFFGPLISRIWGQAYVHYPYNFYLLPKLFYYAQSLLDLLVGSFLLAVSIRIIGAYNNNERMKPKKALKDCLPSYLHVFLAACLSYAFFFGFAKLYHRLYIWAAAIQAPGGIHGTIKKIVMASEIPVQFLAGVFITALFVYVVPIIVLEKKKIFGALWQGLKMFFRSFWVTLFFVLIATVFYLPVLIARDRIDLITSSMFPEMELIVLVLSVICATLLDCVISAAAVTYYLYSKESSK
ncbi:MAG: hypothetical protein KGK03_06610 [Candidatus Omnitrophica bacterium]|nr:hypothetical protein [Candidatus Omnitrophota bacterium]